MSARENTADEPILKHSHETGHEEREVIGGPAGSKNLSGNFESPVGSDKISEVENEELTSKGEGGSSGGTEHNGGDSCSTNPQMRNNGKNPVNNLNEPGEKTIKPVDRAPDLAGNVTEQPKTATRIASIKRGVEKLKTFAKSEFAVLMAYTTFTALVSGFAGALVALLGNQYMSLGPTQSNEISSPVPAPAPLPPTPLPQSPVHIEDAIREIEEKLKTCQAGQDADKKNIANLTEYLKKLNSDMGGLTNKYGEIEKQTEEKYKSLTDNVLFQKVMVDTQITELKNVFVSKEWLFLILLMGVFEVAVIGVVWTMWQKFTDSVRQEIRERREQPPATRSVANGRTSSLGRGVIQGDEKVLAQVSKCALQKRVCVVGFHSETINRHTTEVKALLAQNEATRPVNVVQFLISSHDDILQMPPAMIYMVFVDFNERNVILEDPNKGLGDLRLTTVQAIDKMGADTVLTYCNEKGSLHLNSGVLYNSDLASVRQHPELRRLEVEQRMLSVSNKFNKNQTDHILKIVKDVVK